jgi:hypothetical protein
MRPALLRVAQVEKASSRGLEAGGYKEEEAQA